MYLTFDAELSPLSLEPRGAYFDAEDGAGGRAGGGSSRKRLATRRREEEEEEAAQQCGSLSEKRLKLGLVHDGESFRSVCLL